MKSVEVLGFQGSRFHSIESKIVRKSKADIFYKITADVKILWKRNRLPEALYLPGEKTLFIQEGRERCLIEEIKDFDIKKRVYFKNQYELERYFQPADREFLSKRGKQ